MFILTIYDKDEDFVESYPRLISLVSQQDDTICYSFVDGLGCIITETYHLEDGDKIRIGLMK